MLRCHHPAQASSSHGARVDSLSHSMQALRSWFSYILRIIVIIAGDLNIVRIGGVCRDPECAPQPASMKDDHRLSWCPPAIAGSMNFGDFGDFGFNFVHFSCPHQSDLVKMNAAYDDYYT